jgi:hypothetical protein
MDPTATEQTARPAPTGCCPPFDPRPWQDREVVWHDKPFVKERVHAFLHVPIDMARRVTRASAKIQAAGAAPEHPLMLADERSPWGSDLYLEVTRAVPGADMASLSGTFMTKVFDGPFRDAPRWAAAMEDHVAAQGRTLRRLLFGYTTCPACARAYDHNYVVMFAEVVPQQ